MDSVYYWENFLEVKQTRLPTKCRINNSSSTKSQSLFLSDSTLYVQAKPSVTFRSLDLPHVINSISTNSHLAYFLSQEGRLWAYGTDELKSGLFCSDTLFSSDSPINLPFFDSTPLVKVSVSKSHAAGISTQGTLIAWGTGSNGELGDLDKQKCFPSVVQKASFFKSIDVACGSNMTAICTEAGLLFLFCRKKNCLKCLKTVSFPSVIKSLQNDFIIQVKAYSDQLLVLNELGEGKLVENCFCVTQLGNKGQVVELVEFDGGLAGLGIDKKSVVVWRKESKGWNADFYALHSGEISKIGKSFGKGIWVLGKGIKKFKKGGSNVDCSFRSDTERVTFDEIAMKLGFKGKVLSLDQEKIFRVLEKVYLGNMKDVMQKIWKYSYFSMISFRSRNLTSGPFILNKNFQRAVQRVLLDIFSLLKTCPKKKLASVMMILKRHVISHMLKYWNSWRSITLGYKQAKDKFSVKLDKANATYLVKTLNTIFKESLRKSFTSFKEAFLITKFNSEKSKIKALNSLERFALKFKFISLQIALGRFQARKTYHTKKSDSLSIISTSLEVLSVFHSKGRTQPPSLSQSFVDSESSNCPSNDTKKNKKTPNPPKNSKKSTESSLDFPFSPVSDISDFSSPGSLSSQISRRLNQKNNQSNKLMSVNEKTMKSLASTKKKPIQDFRKIILSKVPINPKSITKPSTDSFRSYKNSKKNAEISLFKPVLRSSKLQAFLTKCKKRMERLVFDSVKKFLEAKPPVLTWKDKMYSLAFHKFARTFSFLVVRRKNFGFKSLQAFRVERL